MNLSFSICNVVQPLISFTGGLNTNPLHFHNHGNKDKVVVVMGATGTGKSRLAIDLAKKFQAEIINSDKIQVYRGLEIATNKVTEEESRGVPHHILGTVDPNVDYSAANFCHDALLAIDSIIEQKKLPIIAGGSNSFIKSLVNDDPYFASRYECCFLWVDVAPRIHQRFVSERVDQMVQAGLVDEVRGIFDPNANYTRGIRRAIGVPEMDRFLRAERNADPETLETLRQIAIDDIKKNTRNLVHRQMQKIRDLKDLWGWNLHHIQATEAFLKQGKASHEAWERLVVSSSVRILTEFCPTITSKHAKFPKITKHNGHYKESTPVPAMHYNANTSHTTVSQPYYKDYLSYRNANYATTTAKLSV